MKLKRITKISIVALAMIFNTVPSYATNVVTANSTKEVKQENISVISSYNGQAVSKQDNLNSMFKLSFTNDNYTTTKFAKIIDNKDKNKYITVYSKPTDKSEHIGDIEIGSTVVIGGQQGDFLQIFFNEQLGYIKKEYIINSEPKEENPVTIQKQNNSEPTGKYVKVTSDVGVNLRKEASISSEILDTIPSNEYADFLLEDKGWTKVKYNGKVGYISSSFVTLADKKDVTVDKEQTLQGNQVTADELIEFAKLHLGKPYIYGSANLNVGTDCSGFTYAVFKHFGINLNRVSRDQYLNGTPVEKSNLKAGDLVFFANDTKNISHVGIYIGENQYIHSTDGKSKAVIISSLETDYSRKTYYGARRILNI